MTKDECKGLLMVIQATYPNFKISDPQTMLNAWYLFLKDYEADQITMSLKTYVATSNTGFAPSVSQLIGGLTKTMEYNELSEAEAWSLVSKALRNSAYHSKEEFERLPKEVQRAVGSPSQLRVWALDESYNESVVMSQFLRTYRTVLQRAKEINQLPHELRIQINERLGIDDKSRV